MCQCENKLVRRIEEVRRMTDDLKEECVYEEVSNGKIGDESDEVDGVCGENR